MTDITMCHGKNCERRVLCDRYTAVASQLQSYSDYDKDVLLNIGCVWFLPNSFKEKTDKYTKGSDISIGKLAAAIYLIKVHDVDHVELFDRSYNLIRIVNREQLSQIETAMRNARKQVSEIRQNYLGPSSMAAYTEWWTPNHPGLHLIEVKT